MTWEAGAEDRRCDLQAAAGRVELCPEEGCPFWDDGKCVVASLRPDFERDPDLATLLLSLRSRLARPPGGAWSPLGLLPPPGDDLRVD
jgi:hypothetical protein